MMKFIILLILINGIYGDMLLSAEINNGGNILTYNSNIARSTPNNKNGESSSLLTKLKLSPKAKNCLKTDILHQSRWRRLKSVNSLSEKKCLNNEEVMKVLGLSKYLNHLDLADQYYKTYLSKKVEITDVASHVSAFEKWIIKPILKFTSAGKFMNIFNLNLVESIEATYFHKDIADVLVHSKKLASNRVVVYHRLDRTRKIMEDRILKQLCRKCFGLTWAAGMGEFHRKRRDRFQESCNGKKNCVPINNEGILWTELTISLGGLFDMKTGKFISDTKVKDAYTHIWGLIGSFMGLPKSMIPNTFKQGVKLFQDIIRGGAISKDKSGKATYDKTNTLLKALEKTMRAKTPTWPKFAQILEKYKVSSSKNNRKRKSKQSTIQQQHNFKKKSIKSQQIKLK